MQVGPDSDRKIGSSLVWKKNHIYNSSLPQQDFYRNV